MPAGDRNPQAEKIKITSVHTFVHEGESDDVSVGCTGEARGNEHPESDGVVPRMSRQVRHRMAMEIARGIELPEHYHFVPDYPRFCNPYYGAWKVEIINKMREALNEFPVLIEHYERKSREDVNHPFKANIALGFMKDANVDAESKGDSCRHCQ